jgi:hypothetical protein
MSISKIKPVVHFSLLLCASFLLTACLSPYHPDLSIKASAQLRLINLSHPAISLANKPAESLPKTTRIPSATPVCLSNFYSAQIYGPLNFECYVQGGFIPKRNASYVLDFTIKSKVCELRLYEITANSPAGLRSVKWENIPNCKYSSGDKQNLVIY